MPPRKPTSVASREQKAADAAATAATAATAAADRATAAAADVARDRASDRSAASAATAAATAAEEAINRLAGTIQHTNEKLDNISEKLGERFNSLDKSVSLCQQVHCAEVVQIQKRLGECENLIYGTDNDGLVAKVKVLWYEGRVRLWCARGGAAALIGAVGTALGYGLKHWAGW